MDRYMTSTETTEKDFSSFPLTWYERKDFVKIAKLSEHDHHFEKMDNHMSSHANDLRDRKSITKDFEETFAKAEEKYFEGLPPMMRMMMNMSFPPEQRMMACLMRYTH